MTPRVRMAGDAGAVVEFDERIDAGVNARVVAAAAALRALAVPGVRDIVPAYRSVALHLDPLATDRMALEQAIGRAVPASAPMRDGRTVRIPVWYGGDAGPDLPAIAAGAGLAPEAVVALHAGTPYRVYMLGFLPGFPYMGPVEPRLAASRRAVPRAHVPAGSVAIAGRQTGIYPQDSPGGWQLIGRTPIAMFDPARVPPALLQPGDTVQFVAQTGRAMPGGHGRDASAHSEAAPAGGRCVTVLRPGLLTTIQDAGRWGHQANGVPVSGPLDPVSHRLANVLVGNDRDAAGLEVTIAGPELRLETRATIAVAGADLEATIDGAPLPLHVAVACRAGGVLRFGVRRRGTRAYVAFDGGVAVPPLLGSRATHVLSRLGHPGRPLRAGDRLPLGAPREAPPRRRVALPAVRPSEQPVRVLAGPQAEAFFSPDAVEALRHARFEVGPHSDRMGYRLTGARLARLPDRDMISDATFTGALQVPPSGEPILLMADRQTTGGYPQLAVVIGADLPVVAQLAPGDRVRFEPCTFAEAIAALVAQEAKFLALG